MDNKALLGPQRVDRTNTKGGDIPGGSEVHYLTMIKRSVDAPALRYLLWIGLRLFFLL